MLTLETSNGNYPNNWCAHSAWGDARVQCNVIWLSSHVGKPVVYCDPVASGMYASRGVTSFEA